jgi:hypothetical protein
VVATEIENQIEAVTDAQFGEPGDVALDQSGFDTSGECATPRR